MPVFSTPEPVRALIDVGGAVTRVQARDGAETSVEVRPHNPGRSADVELAQRVTVDLTDGRLRVHAPRNRRARLRSLFGGSERVDLDIVLPAGSELETRGWGDVTTEGALGAVDIDTGMGDIKLDRVAAVRAKTAMGEIAVRSAGGPADLRTAMGTVQVGRAAGDVVARTSTGDVRVEDAAGELRLSTSAGDVRVERATSGVRAKTSAGDVRLQSVCRGSVTATTSYGQLEIGVAHGTAAWLDVEARHGVVRSELEPTDGPGDSELTVEIHATSGFGDIVLRRV
jgi:hypothetical protein